MPQVVPLQMEEGRLFWNMYFYPPLQKEDGGRVQKTNIKQQC